MKKWFIILSGLIAVTTTIIILSNCQPRTNVNPFESDCMKLLDCCNSVTDPKGKETCLKYYQGLVKDYNTSPMSANLNCKAAYDDYIKKGYCTEPKPPQPTK